MAAVRHHGFVMRVCVGTTHGGHLVVFIAVQNSVGIDAGVDNACFSMLRLFTPQSGFSVV